MPESKEDLQQIGNAFFVNKQDQAKALTPKANMLLKYGKYLFSAFDAKDVPGFLLRFDGHPAFNEVIDKQNPVRLVCDFEINNDEGAGYNWKLAGEYAEILHEAVCEEIAKIRPETKGKIKANDCRIACASRDNKISFHYHMPFYTVNIGVQKHFWQHVADNLKVVYSHLLPVNDEGEQEGIDFAIYERNHPLRVVNSFKEPKPFPPKKTATDDERMAYLDRVEKNKNTLLKPVHFSKTYLFSTNEDFTGGWAEFEETKIADYSEWLINAPDINDRAKLLNLADDEVKVGEVVATARKDIEDVIREKFPGVHFVETKKNYWQLNAPRECLCSPGQKDESDNGMCFFRGNRLYYTCSDPVHRAVNKSILLAEFGPQIKYQRINRDDDYTFRNFMLDYRFPVFDSIADMYAKTAKDFSRVGAFITTGNSGHWIKKESNDRNTYKLYSLKDADIMSFNYLDDNDKSKKMILKDYIKGFPIMYEGYELFAKFPKYDVWPGFHVKPTQAGPKGDLILQHVREVLAYGDESAFDVICSWLKHILTEPQTPTGKVLFFHSKPGAGKGKFCEFLANHVFGRQIATTVDSPEHIVKEFNSTLANKIYIDIAECSVDKAKWKTDWEKMKDKITGSYQQINKKGIDEDEFKSILNMTMSSNHWDAINIQQGDRRYLCFDVSDHRIGQEDYFKPLLSAMDSEGAGQFMASILAMDTKYSITGKSWDSPLRQKIIALQHNNVMRFLTEFRDEHKEELKTGYAGRHDDWKEKLPMNHWPKDLLWSAYQLWCADAHEKVYRKMTFEQKLTDADHAINRVRYKDENNDEKRIRAWQFHG